MKKILFTIGEHLLAAIIAVIIIGIMSVIGLYIGWFILPKILG